MKSLLSAAAVVALSFTGVTAAQADTEPEETVVATSRVEIVNTETGEVVYQNSEQIVLDPDSNTATIESPLPVTGLSAITPFASVGGSMNPGSCKSEITITYTLKPGQIRTERVTGKWTPARSIILQNRSVDIYSGGGNPAIIKKKPTANTYDYSTGWGFQTKPPSNPLTSPRVLAQVQYKLSGTAGAWLQVRHWVDLSSV